MEQPRDHQEIKKKFAQMKTKEDDPKPLGWGKEALGGKFNTV